MASHGFFALSTGKSQAYQHVIPTKFLCCSAFLLCAAAHNVKVLLPDGDARNRTVRTGTQGTGRDAKAPRSWSGDGSDLSGKIGNRERSQAVGWKRRASARSVEGQSVEGRSGSGKLCRAEPTTSWRRKSKRWGRNALGCGGPLRRQGVGLRAHDARTASEHLAP